jgi:hypothetical protein
VSDTLPAGAFAEWVVHARDSIRSGATSDVPCGSCTACCRSAQFVHVGPDETDALAHIPAELLVPAPGRPAGHLLLGYDAQGRCPMLTERGCSIYDHRPRACRAYDCRVFAAADVDPADDGKGLIAERTRRWRFDEPTQEDQTRRRAVRSAAQVLLGLPEVLPRGATATTRAVMAVDVHGAFLRRTDDGRLVAVEPTPERVAQELAAPADGLGDRPPRRP